MRSRATSQACLAESCFVSGRTSGTRWSAIAPIFTPKSWLDDIKQAYEHDLVDPGCIGFDGVKRDLAVGKDRILARLVDNPHRRLVEDTVAEMGCWACFREK